MDTQGISYQAMPTGSGYGDNGIAAAALACALNPRREDYGRGGYNWESCLMSAIESTDDHVVAHMGQTANQTQTLASQVSNGTLTLANQLCGVNGDLSGKLADGFMHTRDGLHSTEARLQSDIFASSGRVTDGFSRQSGELCSGFARTNDHLSNFERGTEKNFGDVMVAIKESQYNTAIAIRDDGDKTRTLASRQYEDTLNRDLTIARDEIIELRNEGKIERRGRETEINISNTNTANATAMQEQSQRQQQLQFQIEQNALLRNLCGDIQAVKQTQSNINFGVQAGTSQGQAATNNRVS